MLWLNCYVLVPSIVPPVFGLNVRCLNLVITTIFMSFWRVKMSLIIRYLGGMSYQLELKGKGVAFVLLLCFGCLDSLFWRLLNISIEQKSYILKIWSLFQWRNKMLRIKGSIVFSK